MDNLIIIGSGPAGVSAALYTIRAGIETTVISSGKSALYTAKEIDNYYGFPTPVSGPDLFANGVASARRLGARVLDCEVVSVEEENDCFTVKTVDSFFSSKAVILATGAARNKPKWQNIDTYEGMGVSYCALCDGFFFKGKHVAVAGSGPYALHEAQALLPIVSSVTLCTDAASVTANFPPEVKIVNAPVAALEGESILSGVRFKDGSVLEVSALFVAIGTAGSSDLANAIGANTHAGNIVVDERMRTSISGLLAAGDCTGGMKQIAKAVYEGAVAGTEAVQIIRKRDK